MIRRSGAIAVLVSALACATAVAAPITVNVRVEGKKKTLFEGNVKAKVHLVNSGDGSGPHHCDGTNGGASAAPGPTLLGAFDTAVRKAHVKWHGAYSNGFDDFTIDKVGPDANDNVNGHYWGQALNYKDTQVGGCQQKVKKGDQVLIAFDSFQHPKLELQGSKHATAGKKYRVKVLDGEKGKPYLKGAVVHGKTTDDNGRATFVFHKAGTVKLKAKADGAIRSNRLKVRVSAG